MGRMGRTVVAMNGVKGVFIRRWNLTGNRPTFDRGLTAIQIAGNFTLLDFGANARCS